MCDRRLSGACLAEDDEGMFRFGIVDPVEDVVEKILACALETALLIAEWPTSRVRRFSDDCCASCQIDDPTLL
jgi:hypothetical protein